MDERERAELMAWVSEILGVESPEFERAVVRREGWIVTAGDDQWFLRLGRDADPANPPAGVLAEGRLVRTLGGAGLAVAPVVGMREQGAVLYGWVPGAADLLREPEEFHQQQLEAYMHQLARLHTLDPDELDLEWMPRPADARDCALAHAEAVWDQMGAMAVEPLSTFGINWLRWHAPEHVERLSVLHGDAGVGNFLVTGPELHGVIDWEWGHIGDPMEDLGSVAMHAGFFPVGDLGRALASYEEASGIHVDHDKVRYYAAHLYVRSVIALSAHVAHLDPHNPVALNLAYKLVNDRLTCSAIADATGVSLEAPALPDDAGTELTLYGVVAANLRDDVAPATSSAFARDRAEMSARLVETLARGHRWGPEIAAIECAELSTLLAEEVDDLDGGLRRLDELIPEWGQAREVDVLRYLSRRAERTAWLAAPVADLFPDRRIAQFAR